MLARTEAPDSLCSRHLQPCNSRPNEEQRCGKASCRYLHASRTPCYTLPITLCKEHRFNRTTSLLCTQSLYNQNSIRAGSVFASSPFFGPTGLVAAKKSTLIAIAKPACRARTTTSRIFDVFASVVERTGYKFLSRKVAEKARPSATKV